MICSMSRRGDCYDNAVMESFFATLKTELIAQERFTTREEAQTRIFEFMEVFYNPAEAGHSTLAPDYDPGPTEFEQRNGVP